jgi:hypothetical protein
MKKRLNFYSYLSFIIVLSLTFKVFQLGDQLSHKIYLTNTLDLSWSTDITERLLHGYIAGRDFVFTYGPLYQFINSLPSLIFGIPSYSSILISPIIMTFLNCICILFITKAFIRTNKDHFLLSAPLLLALGLLSNPDPNNLLRILLPLAYTILYANMLEKKNFHINIFLILSLPAIFGLYSYDLFITCTIITVITLAYHYFTTNKQTVSKQYILYAALQLLLIACWELLTSFIVSGNLNYLLYSFDTIRSYQFIMNIPFSINKSTLFLIYPLSALILFLYIIRSGSTYTKLLFLCMTTALLEIKAAFIRSDDGHIFTGTYASLLMLIIFLYVLLWKKRKGWYIAFILLVCLLVPYKNSTSFSFSIPNLQAKTFFDIYQLPKNYYLTKEDFTYFNSFIINNKGKVMIFPYDNYLLNIYGTTYNTLPLQWYDYSNSLVEAKAIERLKHSPPKYIILGVDKKGVVVLDNIPNFSRSPLLAKWMLSNYGVYKKSKTYLILNYDPKRKAKDNDESCTVYDFDTKKIIQSNIFEQILKPSTYYLNTDRDIRLPNMANTTRIFLINNYDDPNELQKLFERKINFSRYYEKDLHLIIIKKFPNPKMKQAQNEIIPVKCYSLSRK